MDPPRAVEAEERDEVMDPKRLADPRLMDVFWGGWFAVGGRWREEEEEGIEGIGGGARLTVPWRGRSRRMVPKSQRSAWSPIVAFLGER